MADPMHLITGTYRCPVCGHRDVAELETTREHVVIECTYCETALEVAPRGPDSVRLSVQVAQEPTIQ